MRLLRFLVIVAIALTGLSPAFGQEKVQKVFGVWQVECNPALGAKKCALFFALFSEDKKTKDKKVAFSWSILPGNDPGTNKVVVRTLNGTLLTDGISVTFSGQKPLRLTYLTCGPRFCYSEFPLTDSWLKAFKAQKSFEVTYKALGGKEFKHVVSLDKFGQAYDFYLSNLK